MSVGVHIDGATQIYAVFGDPVAQVQTPRLINPIFAGARRNIVAVPFHVTPDRFDQEWDAFRALSNVAGIGVTVPHKMAAYRRCDTVSDVAAAVGAVNSIQRGADGTMHGALFDGLGFVQGLGLLRNRLRGADVLLLGAGGAGRAIAHALAGEAPGRLQILDRDGDAAAATVDIANQAAGRDIAVLAGADAAAAAVWINATPMGLREDDVFPMDFAALRSSTLVADIASLSRGTALLRHARALGCGVSDGNDMLTAQIALIAGFAAGLTAGTPLV